MIIRQATFEDVRSLGPRLRWGDRIEATLASGMPPEVALENSFRDSDVVWSICENDIPVAMAGVGPLNEKTKGLVGVPWLLSSEGINANPTKTMRVLKEIFINITLIYPKLINFVFADNLMAIKLVRHLGFTVAEVPEPCGPEGVLFYRFWVGF
jgi:hypothetical protein